MSAQNHKPVLSPCIGVCQLGDDGLCLGCLRSAAEIGAWLGLSDAERTHFLDVVLPRREAERL